MENNNIKQGLTYGIIGGLIFLVQLFGSWAICSVKNFVIVSGITSIFPFLFIILLVVGFKLRKDNGGLYSFQEALQFTFFAYVVFAIIEAFGNYLLYALVDTDLTKNVIPATILLWQQLFEYLGFPWPDEEISNKDVKRQLESEITNFKQVFLGLGLAIVLNFVKALILSIIIKKNEEIPDQI